MAADPPGASEDEVAAGVARTQAHFERLTGRRHDGPPSAADVAYVHREAARHAATTLALRRQLAVPPADAVLLDVGCGTGESLAALATAGFARGNLLGVDLAANRVKQAAERHPGIRFVAGDGLTLPLPDASVDVAMAVETFCVVHPAAARRRLAAEMLRVVRPGGLLVSYDVTPAPLAARAAARALRTLPTRARARPAADSPEPAGVDPAPPPNFEPTAADLRALWPGAEVLEARRLSPYRFLAEELAEHPRLLWLAEALPAFSSALLLVARAPAGAGSQSRS